jgi:phosphoribosylamine--glycine ligase
MMQARTFGTAGDRVIVEERLSGPEMSVLAFTDGKTVMPMPVARDHKRAYDNDEGPNTGGMGAYAPAPDVSQAQIDDVCRTILQPAIDGMAAEGTPYVGVLYAGLMVTNDGMKLLEFNCRFGDPETQVILPLLETDLFEIFMACVTGSDIEIAWRQGSCATVVLASPGYPGSYRTGLRIDGVGEQEVEDLVVFHAGTARREGELVTAGGRVLAVTAVGEDLSQVIRRAYAGVKRIHFENMHYRRDIGKQYLGENV